MYILLPYKGYMASAECLSDRHLRSQINVVKLTLKGLYNFSPLPGMWKGHIFQLACYGLSACWVYQQRGERKWPADQVYEDNAFIARFRHIQDSSSKPPWIGDPWVHRSHRARLLNRSEGGYDDLFPGNPTDIPTFWPKLDDSDSRGYRLYVDAGDLHLVKKEVFHIPEGLYLKGREVLEE